MKASDVDGGRASSRLGLSRPGLALLLAVAACGSEPAITAPPPKEVIKPAARVVINEISTFNGDFIEFFNAGDADDYVGSWSLKTSMLTSAPLGDLIPGSTRVPAGGFLLLADGHLHIDLRHDGDFVQLINDQDVIIDAIEWSAAEASPSYGRFRDGEDWLLTMLNPTPGSPNRIDPPTNNPSPVNIVINEVKANSPDQIELFSLESEPVHLEGFWYIDSSNNPDNQRFVFGPDASIEPGAFVALNDLPFGLLNAGDHVALFDPENRLVDFVEWPEYAADISYCRIPDGTGEPAVCSASTLGTPNMP